MIKNYFKIAWRNLIHHKSYSAINILGLTVGISCCILISLYIKDELSYDQYHKNAERIAAIGTNHSYFGKMLNTPYPLAEALASEIPEVERATRFVRASTIRLGINQENFVEVEKAKYAEPGFFDVFSYELLIGNEQEALRYPNQIVLTQSVSKQLFGNTNPLGLTVNWAQRDTLLSLEVSGVIQDPPQNTAVPFGSLISFNTLSESRRPADGWGMYAFNTFVLLKEGGSVNSISKKSENIARLNYEEGSRPSFFAVPLPELHLSEYVTEAGFSGNVKYLYFFGSIAVFILFIACVNYVNLATARISTRTKEVGIRKTLGAERMQIIWQFLGESVLFCLLAYILSISVTGFILPFFNQLFGVQLVWESNRYFLLLLGIATLGIGLLAGFYPSLYMSRFSPSSILKNNTRSNVSGGSLRKILVVSQFAIALVLIICSTIIYKQLQYMQVKDLGFDGEQVLVVNLPTKEAWSLRNIILNDLKSFPGIVEATAADALPGEFGVSFGLTPNELSTENGLSSESERNAENSITLYPAVVDYNFLSTLDIELLAGRNFSREYTSDVENGYLINRKTAELLGWTPEEAIGKTYGIKKEGTVIGVVENFHLASLHEDISAVSLQLHEAQSWFNYGKIAARIAPDRITEAILFIEQQLKKYAPYQPFNYEFMDDKFDAMYRTEQRLGKVSGIFTGIAIFIACLGLFGLAAFSAERRTKEIGIRKVLGATITNIVTLLSKDFVKLVIIGFVIAVPIAWYVMNQWLADFAYKIEIGAGIFLVAGGTALAIALLTVSWQSIRAGLANPVESLRSE